MSMRKTRTVGIVLMAIVAASVAAERAAMAGSNEAKGTTFYDATQYEDKPAEPLEGMEPMPVWSRWYMTANRDESKLAEAHFRERLRELDDGVKRVVLNVEGEGWEVDPRDGRKEARAALEQWAQTLTIAKEERPDVAFGVYRMFPVRDYWAPVRYRRDRDVEAMRGWIDANTWLLTEPIETEDGWTTIDQLIDFAAPSLYEFYPEPEQWEVYARANIAQARRFSDEVLPFIWPRAHPGGRDRFEGAGYLEPDHWRTILELCIDERVDPIIWSSRYPWEEDQDRWYEVWREAVMD